jgi:hypothetical protein
MFPLPFLFFIRSFFASILEPLLWSKGIVVRGFLWTHHNSRIRNDHVEVNYLNGMLYALVSIILGVLFTLMNGKLIQNHDATVISFMSLLRGVISLYFLYENKFTADFFVLSFNNWALMLILASICTAYALRPP